MWFLKFFLLLFSHKLLIPFRFKDDFGYLWLVFGCFITNGGLQCSFRTRYHSFSRVTIGVTLMLPYFCGNSIPILIFSLICLLSDVKLYALTYLSDFRHVITRYHQFFKKRYVLIFFLKRSWWLYLIIAWKSVNYAPVLLKIYWRTLVVISYNFS